MENQENNTTKVKQNENNSFLYRNGGWFGLLFFVLMGVLGYLARTHPVLSRTLDFLGLILKYFNKVFSYVLIATVAIFVLLLVAAVFAALYKKAKSFFSK